MDLTTLTPPPPPPGSANPRFAMASLACCCRVLIPAVPFFAHRTCADVGPFFCVCALEFLLILCIGQAIELVSTKSRLLNEVVGAT